MSLIRLSVFIQIGIAGIITPIPAIRISSCTPKCPVFPKRRKAVRALLNVFAEGVENGSLLFYSHPAYFDNKSCRTGSQK